MKKHVRCSTLGSFSPVILGGYGEQPIVLGKTKRRLTWVQYKVVSTLLKAGEKGLKMVELQKYSGVTEARIILRRLAKSDPDWCQLIQMAGHSGRGYRITSAKCENYCQDDGRGVTLVVCGQMWPESAKDSVCAGPLQYRDR